MPGGTGGTFLDWTINYLTSKDLSRSYIDVKNSYAVHRDVEIVQNPLSFNTAHNHKKTHGVYSDFNKVWEVYNNELQTSSGIFTAYMCDDMLDNRKKVTSGTSNRLIKQYPKIFKNILFSYTYKHIDTIFVWKCDRVGFDSEFSFRFPNCNNKWEEREECALYYPIMIRDLLLSEDCSDHNNTCIIDFNTYITNFDIIIDDVIKEIGLVLLDDRVDHWKNVYKQWLKSVDLLFINDISSIVADIVNGNSRNLTKYNMTFGKEIALYSNLLFEHNLSLMSYGYKKMPLNTKDWHNLLEKNIYHNLNEYRINS
jgi:hypothetical protein